MKSCKLLHDMTQKYQNKEDGNSYIPVTFYKNTDNTGGKIPPEKNYQELLLMKNTYFGAIHYDIHLDMKLENTISTISQEMSFYKLETLHIYVN